MPTKVTSCGVLLYEPIAKTLILGHSTGGAHWDIPKGMQDPGETAIETALRELREETGISLEPKDVLDLGIQPYRPDKQLHLFIHWLRSPVDIASLSCASKFKDKRGVWHPELDNFAEVAVTQLSEYVTFKMWRTLTNVLALEGAIPA